MSVEVGQEAPDFELRDQHGQPVRLSDYRGKRNVVLVFYPFSFSRTCEGELCSLRDEFDDFVGADAQVLAVSVDSPFVQRRWAEDKGYQFPVLADFWPHGAVARGYGVFDEQLGVAHRGTFVIDRDGVVRWQTRSAISDARDQSAYKDALAALA
jgi:peroxiredoxin